LSSPLPPQLMQRGGPGEVMVAGKVRAEVPKVVGDQKIW
jgi:hypothetical protein